MHSCNSGYTPPQNSILSASIEPSWPRLRIGSRLLKPSTEGPPVVAPIPHVHIVTSPTDCGMVETVPAEPAWLLRHLTVPVAAAVALAVGATWYATWTSADVLMALTPPSLLRSTDFVLFFALLVVMMVAMMLPSALPMILAFRGMTRLEAGRPTRPVDDAATALFIAPYFLVWGAFGVAALLALMASGLLGAITRSEEHTSEFQSPMYLV